MRTYTYTNTPIQLYVPTYTHTQVSAVPTEDITEEQFFNMYGELVREQDSASPGMCV